VVPGPGAAPRPPEAPGALGRTRLSGVVGILAGMTGKTGRAVIPAWVVPPAATVDDVLWVARAAQESPTDSVRIEARGAAVAWVLGCGAAPVTGRSDTPVTWGLANAELWAALVVCDRRSPPPRDDVCAGWGVQYVPPLTTVGLAVGDGVARALG
jgi:hypothetical protein